MVLIDNVAHLSAGVQNLMADTDNGLLLGNVGCQI